MECKNRSDHSSATTSCYHRIRRVMEAPSAFPGFPLPQESSLSSSSSSILLTVTQYLRQAPCLTILPNQSTGETLPLHLPHPTVLGSIKSQFADAYVMKLRELLKGKLVSKPTTEKGKSKIFVHCKGAI